MNPQGYGRKSVSELLRSFNNECIVIGPILHVYHSLRLMSFPQIVFMQMHYCSDIIYPELV